MTGRWYSKYHYRNCFRIIGEWQARGGKSRDFVEIKKKYVPSTGHTCHNTRIIVEYSTRTRTPRQRRIKLTLEISARARNFRMACCLASRSVASSSPESIVATKETGVVWRKAMVGDGVVADEVGVVMAHVSPKQGSS
jgi:hypothetical protein